MTVLPGSLFVVTAWRDQIAPNQGPVGHVRHSEFRNLVVVADQKVQLSMSARWLDAQIVQYTFQEADPSGLLATAEKRPCAVIEIECAHPSLSAGLPSLPTPALFQKQASAHWDKTAFYEQLRGNGNQYGPYFQNIEHVWRFEAEALAQLKFKSEASAGFGPQPDPILLDSVIQVLACFFVEQGRTFLLQGTGRISTFQDEFTTGLWVHARLHPTAGATPDERTGELDVFDDSGKCALRLEGVRFSCSAQAEPKGPTIATPETQIVVASTFTAEPVESSLRFWSKSLAFPVSVKFAPYNQVFQQLLNTSSELRKNSGLNAILLNLEDWAEQHSSALLNLKPAKESATFENRHRRKLPNGLEVADLNGYETDYLYKEIFEDRCYLRHGIQLPGEANVIDIGANIGLFSLFVCNESTNARIYAYEPNPVAFRALKANCEAYGPKLFAFNMGVSEHRGTAALTFYEKSSVFSSFHPNLEEDGRAIKAVVANVLRRELDEDRGSVDDYAEEFMQDRLQQQTFDCSLVSVNDIVREHNLDVVDLLKIDAEKCELEILRGIDDAFWPRISQVVVEVHDRKGHILNEVKRILCKHGFECAVEEEHLLAGSGLFNVYASRPGRKSAKEGQEQGAAGLERKINDFFGALELFTKSAGAPTVVCFCPTTRDTPARPKSIADAAEEQLLSKLRELPNLSVISSQELRASCRTTEFHDRHTAELGHVPYTAAGFAAIGTMLFRRLVALHRRPYKVIAVDCDNTLWQGACGEEGAQGVVVTPGQLALQKFMIEQVKAGMLLCLCSKNNEADVWSVFEQNPAMALKREHVAAWRINWNPKSQNLESLASELNVGLDSMIMLDDNPVECAEIRANAAEAFTLQLPTEVDRFPHFLENAWVFDHLRVTEEDRGRTQKIRQNSERERLRERVTTLRDFIAGLNLKIEIIDAAVNLNRCSQLTLRTNQFNLTTVRRSENDLHRFLEQEDGHAMAVKVSDRFGDYGLVGLVLYQLAADAVSVDTFLLSCRALGRGVEHEMLAEIGRRGLAHGKPFLDFTLRHTSKNQPACEFLESLAAESQNHQEGKARYRFSAEKAAGLRYEPADAPPSGLDQELPRRAQKSDNAWSMAAETVQRIAQDLSDAKQICMAIECAGRAAKKDESAQLNSDLDGSLSGRMLAIWRRLIGNPSMGLNDNFVEAGGTSLKAVQVAAAVRRELKLPLSIVNIFECPTVSLLCEKLQPAQCAKEPANGALARGAKRRQKALKRV
jgi:FkbH-like protein/FkbM family methyltransferase